MSLIRAAVAADIPAIHRLIVDLAVYEREPDAVKATEAQLHQALFGERPIAEAVVAEHEGAAVGLPKARGLGIGKALLVHLAGIAVARDYARFEWSVLDWNEPAIGFYRSLGAEMQGEWTKMRVDGDALKLLAGA